ncbi:hypothetical protein C0991_007056 [Blastosporella zonata]|nr:hypothetical protein C0991_007056 [Blastosporella zonata]
MAPSFAELKAKAAKAKDVSVAKIQSTRDRNTSIPMKKTNWDPYSGQPAPPPPPPRLDSNSRPAAAKPMFPPPPSASSRSAAVAPPPPPSRTPSLPSRPSTTHSSPSPVPPAPAPRPPPRQLLSSSSSVSGGPPPIIRSTRPDQPSRQLDEPVQPTIDWTNLSPQDKEVFFSWLDEFFNKFLNIDVTSPRR